MKFSFILLISSFAFSQHHNYNFEQFGNQSTMLLGNVTASVNDLGLAYYNPSRLAFNDAPSFMLNARAYSLKKIAIIFRPSQFSP